MGFLNYMAWLTLTSIHGSGLANFKGDQMTLPILRVDVAYQALSLEFAKYLQVMYMCVYIYIFIDLFIYSLIHLFIIYILPTKHLSIWMINHHFFVPTHLFLGLATLKGVQPHGSKTTEPKKLGLFESTMTCLQISSVMIPLGILLPAGMSSSSFLMSYRHYIDNTNVWLTQPLEYPLGGIEYPLASTRRLSLVGMGQAKPSGTRDHSLGHTIF